VSGAETAAEFSGLYPATIGLILLLVGIVGLILSIRYWSPWDSPGAWSRRRPHSNQAAGGPSYY
jgi:hypothetical protein